MRYIALLFVLLAPAVFAQQNPTAVSQTPRVNGADLFITGGTYPITLYENCLQGWCQRATGLFPNSAYSITDQVPGTTQLYALQGSGAPFPLPSTAAQFNVIALPPTGPFTLLSPQFQDTVSGTYRMCGAVDTAWLPDGMRGRWIFRWWNFDTQTLEALEEVDVWIDHNPVSNSGIISIESPRRTVTGVVEMCASVDTTLLSNAYFRVQFRVRDLDEPVGSPNRFPIYEQTNAYVVN